MACENFQASVDALEQKKAELQADLVDFGPTANKNILKKIRAQLIQTNSSLAAAQQQLADCLNSITQPSQPCDGIQAQVDELEQQQVGIRGDLADLGPNGNLITIRKLQTELAQTNIALAASQKQLFDCLNPLPPLPPGELRDKVISLAYLQSKCDVFFNQRAHPLLQIRLHGKNPGESHVSVALESPVTQEYNHDEPFFSAEFAGPGQQLSADFGLLLGGNHLVHFSDLRTDRIELNVIPGSPLGVNLFLHFETEGLELRVQALPDIDFDGFHITLGLQFGVHDQQLDLLSWLSDIDAAINSLKFGGIQNAFSDKVIFTYTFQGKDGKIVVPALTKDLDKILRLQLASEFINIALSVNVNNLPDGLVRDGIKDVLFQKILDRLNDADARRALNRVATRWLVGGDFPVLDLSSDDASLTIRYILPPGQLEPFPEDLQPPLDPGLLTNIEHIVVLMMENRSFDHMLGYLTKQAERPDVDGLPVGGFTNPFLGHDLASFRLESTVFKCDPDHGHIPTENQIAGGTMSGFASEFARKASLNCSGLGAAADPRMIMGFHTADQVPVYDALAKEFLICNRWFSAHPGPTFPNRFYTLTGRLNRDSFGNFEVENFHGDDFRPVFTRTIFDHLNDHGVGWRYYEHDYGFIRMFARYTTDDRNVIDAGPDSINFVTDALAGNLPQVTFIDPDFIDIPPGADDGPPADVAAGQHFVGTVVNAVMHGPLWSKTLLIIVYDEHGGFFDHVKPPSAVAVSAGIDHLGVRVPAFVVSPWVDRLKVADFVFDHTSIAKTIARCFMSANPPDMGARVAAANDLSQVLRSTPRQDSLPDIPIPDAPAVDPVLAHLAEQNMAGERDFKGALRSIRTRFPFPGKAIQPVGPRLGPGGVVVVA